MSILQAIEYLGCQEKLSPITKHVYSQLRAIFPSFVEDLPKYKDLKKVKEYLQSAAEIISFNQK